jgi:hypothetical protein
VPWAKKRKLQQPWPHVHMFDFMSDRNTKATPKKWFAVWWYNVKTSTVYTYIANSKKPKGPETKYFVSSLLARDCPWLRVASCSTGLFKSQTAHKVQIVGGKCSKFMVSYWLS